MTRIGEGMGMVISSAMMATTTNSSTSVKPVTRTQKSLRRRAIRASDM